MEGIQFLTNANGEKTAVVIDLKEHGDLWEDFYDILVAHSRQDEPRESIVDIQAVRHRSKAYE